MPGAAGVGGRRIRRIATAKNTPKASAPAVPTAAATRTASALSAATATASSASAARWQPKWIARGRSAVSAEGVGGRLLPRVLDLCRVHRRQERHDPLQDREQEGEQPAADQDEPELRRDAVDRSVVDEGQREDEARHERRPRDRGRA